MKKILIGIAAAGFLITSFLTGGQAWAQKRVAWVLPGTINDEGFNQTGYEAVLRLEKMGYEVASRRTPRLRNSSPH